MKTELQKALASLAPSICIKTTWEHDHDCHAKKLAEEAQDLESALCSAE